MTSAVVAETWDAAQWSRRAGVLVRVRVGLDERAERADLAFALRTRQRLVSVRVYPNEILVGPLWSPIEVGDHGDEATDGGCPGCVAALDRSRRWAPDDRFTADRAEREERQLAGIGRGSAEHRALRTSPAPDPHRSGWAPWRADLVAAVLTADPDHPMAPGQLVAIDRGGRIRRHLVHRVEGCAVCGPGETLIATVGTSPAPAPWRRQARPTRAALPTRADRPPFDLDPERMRVRQADPRFGPITGITRHSAGAFPISEAQTFVGTPAGMGRGVTFRESEAIAVLEAHERMAGYPHHACVVAAVSRAELGDLALDPGRLGQHTARQLGDPTCRVQAYHDDLPMDWVWATPLDGSAPRLVPAEIGFFRYRYDVRAPGPAEAPGVRRNVFLESSSGSALGGSPQEAALHSLLELAERDAFLLAWHRARPLPEIDPATITDPQSRFLLQQADVRGYDVHLLRATADIDIPVVWALAVRRDGGMGATFSAAGGHPDPLVAVRSALWELTQMVTGAVVWDIDELRPLITDPWLVQTIAQHWRLYAFPEMLPKVTRVLGGPTVSVTDAFPQWPQRLVRAAGGDITGALDHVAGLFAAVGLEEILVVEQSTAAQVRQGLHVVKCVVPGIVPMCFGHAHQRLDGLPRLANGLGRTDDIPFDPHPFP